MPERKDGRRFEPPPWEREQFDELARKRESQQADKEIDASLQLLEAATTTPEQGQDIVAAPVPEAKSDLAPQRDQGTVVRRGGEIEEARLIEMLSQLAAEEPRAMDEWWRVGLFGAAVTASIGLMLVVLGTVGLLRTARSGPTGLMGGFVLLGFGFSFIGIAAWTTVRTLKQRGVL